MNEFLGESNNSLPIDTKTILLDNFPQNNSSIIIDKSALFVNVRNTMKCVLKHEWQLTYQWKGKSCSIG